VVVEIVEGTFTPSAGVEEPIANPEPMGLKMGDGIMSVDL